jgi:LCP family protein required for cell wall assembly
VARSARGRATARSRRDTSGSDQINGSARRRQIARVMVAVVSALVLIVTGYGWSVYHNLSAGLTKSSALEDAGNGIGSAGGDSSGPVNILIMGLDSRLDQNGNPLPASVLDQLHAGDSSNGGYNTNVMMLLHVPGTGDATAGPAVDKPVGISIPRDDYVSLPGQPSGVSKAKIKEGYGLAKLAAERQLRNQGVTDPRELERQGREAGRKQTIASVENFLGARIDHFVEVTLVGFYDLAQALGSVTVCLTGPTQDDYSGARFAKGYQQLNAAQALAFVRQRRDYVHPELNFTDLDRARRQQAFVASAGYQLNSAGTLANPAGIHDLIEVATKDIVIDNGLDLLGFAEQAPRLLGGGLSFTTLPVKAFSTIDGQDVNLVDDAQIKSVVRGLLGSDDANTPSTGMAPQLPAGTLDIINGSGRNGLATTLNRALARRGLTPGSANTDRVTRTRTTLSYSPDAQPAAQALAELLNQPTPQPDPSLNPGHLRLVLGTDFTTPTELTTTHDGNSAAATPANTTSEIPASSIHTTGIPCVK